MKSHKTIGLKLDLIRIDGDTQSRCEVDQGHIEDLREAIVAKDAGASIPPIVVFHDGKDYWLADGFHRYHAMRAEKIKQAAVDVYKGTKRDAKLYAAAANAGHGLKRTNADKRRAVQMLLDDSEWRKWSDHKIAEHCGVSHPFVAGLRKQLVTVTSSRTGRDGKTRQVPVPTQRPQVDPPPPAEDEHDAPPPLDDDSTPQTLVDRAGFAVPDRLRHIFDNRAIRDLSDLILRCKHRADELTTSDIGRKLPTARITNELENARKAILFAEPFAVCPLCSAGRGRGDGCKTCNDTGWLIREAWATVPEEMKQ